ncbi:MAG: glutamate racemase [Deltaproteobacteria bacterium]|nr:glutamate racemase [Deltaproteobacteria bacterium]
MSNYFRGKKPIGIFDSGIGGLTVLKEILNVMPWEDTVYLGDTARVPYGTKSVETVTRYSFENARFLLKFDIKLLVVACNTASAYCLRQLQQELPIPVIGVIEPGARKAVEVTKTKRIGVIGTEGTIRSNAYVDAIMRIYGNGKTMIAEHGDKHFDRYFEITSGDVVIFTKACPLFVPLSEEGWTNNDVARLTVEHYLKGLKSNRIDTLILGCTHYPLLKDVIQKVMGENVALIDSGRETAADAAKCLMDRGIIGISSSKQGSHRFFVTDSPDRFKQVGSKFMTANVDNVELINVEKAE